jgi:hypothetical protein
MKRALRLASAESAHQPCLPTLRAVQSNLGKAFPDTVTPPKEGRRGNTIS